MEQHWKELLPIDKYQVKSRGVLQELDRKVITALYQPLIGAISYSLYMTLWEELEHNRLWGKENNHYSLMTAMQLNLKLIYQERMKLEGIGLLKLYYYEQDPRLFIYELLPPLTPKQFFQDGMLNIYLFNRVGKNKYNQLKQFFLDEAVPNGGKEITKSFSEVFKSIHTSELKNSEFDHNDEIEGEFLEKEDGKQVIVAPETFNESLFLEGLSEHIVPKKALTANVMEAVYKLSYLYGIDAIEMKNVLLNALDHDDKVNIESLRKAARDWYSFSYGDQVPKLVDRKQPLQKKSPTNQLDDKEKQLVTQLESITPRQFLIDLANGAEPSSSDLEIIEEVMFQQNLLPGVVNVLIYYVMLKTNMKLSKAYIQKIASHWSRCKVETVSDAMTLAKNEHRKYQQWASSDQPKRSKDKRSSVIRKEKLPKWMQQTDDEKKSNTNNKTDEQFEREKQQLEKRIKQYMSNKKSTD
ncbi:replication initiation and membrane attachment family protein [Bacillus carboniphilus]|uniref:Replication initiation and membrane attachment family protein n=1 Tax=Bacillus carboniphilus TaxID=86663 RepID=A0ABY9JZE8_9BACI|nr:replication initiation and membrane attachment family protein [Bacillus carboniphilus]WLR44153.1 replication initiation and membrane attachment family protein [Bacillus carboniphilus]